MKKLLLALLLIPSLAWAGSTQRVITYVMHDGTSAGTIYDGGPEDSLQTGTNYNTQWIPVLGARYVEILLRDSLTTGSAYVDSMGAASFHLSYDKSNYVVPDLNGLNSLTGFSDQDSVDIRWTGKLYGVNLSGGQSGVQFPGYLRAAVYPDHDTAEENADVITYNWLRVSVQPAGRKRCPDPPTCGSTQNASVIGVRILVRVFYANIDDSFVPPGED